MTEEQSLEQQKSQAIAEMEEDREFTESLAECMDALDEVEQKENCPHLWVRRREGSWCAFCHTPRWGQELSEQERERLRRMREGNQG